MSDRPIPVPPAPEPAPTDRTPVAGPADRPQEELLRLLGRMLAERLAGADAPAGGDA